MTSPVTTKTARSPFRWRFAVIGVGAALLALQAGLLLSPDALWTGGTGVLRGTRRGFGAGAAGSWDSLGLFVAIAGAFLTAGVGASIRSAVAVAGMAALATLNDSRLLATAWTLSALSCALELDGTRRIRWTAATLSVVATGVALSALVVRDVPGMLHAPAGYGGAFDGAGIAMIRHILTGLIGGGTIDLIVLPPVLVCMASVCMAAGAGRPVAAIAVAAGPLLLLKLYPLIELAVRDGPSTGALLAVPGALLVLWSGLRTPSHPVREGLLASGGTMVLLSARLPLETAVWTVAWAALSVQPGTSFVGPQLPLVIASLLALSGLSGTATHPVGFAVCFALAAGVVLAIDRPVRGPRRVAGFILGCVLVAVLVPPIAPRFWHVWSGKLRPALPGALAPWATVVGGCAAGIVLRTAGKRWRILCSECLAVVQSKASGWMTRWASPVVDTVAVVWVAAERFGWQGLSLWLPRRVLVTSAIAVSWFQAVVVPTLSRIPLHPLGPLRRAIILGMASPRWCVLGLALLLALAWLL